MQKLTVARRELAELFQESPSKNGLRVLLMGSLSVMFGTFGLVRLLSSAASAQSHQVLASISADRWPLIDFALSGACIGWWYWMERKGRRLQRRA